METNRTTLTTYQEKFNNYIVGTPHGVSGTQKAWIDQLLQRVDAKTSILEIGSAFGRDAHYMQQAGYMNVTVTDAFDAAIDSLKERGFTNAQKLNILTDEPYGEYGLIFASAVFLHFTEQEFELALSNIHNHLGAKGLLAFTVKEGDGEEWSSAKMEAPRFFHYWREAPLKNAVQKCGYKVLEMTTNEEFSQKWLAVTCQPINEL